VGPQIVPLLFTADHRHHLIYLSMRFRCVSSELFSNRLLEGIGGAVTRRHLSWSAPICTLNRVSRGKQGLRMPLWLAAQLQTLSCTRFVITVGGGRS